MKKYIFLIKKSKEMEIEVYAENHSEALFELLKNAVKKDKKFFIDKSEDRKDLYIKVKKIIDEKGKENIKDYENFMEENSFFIGKENENILEKNTEEIEDDLPKEYADIICEKCGNCIPIDEVIHQLES